jgi:hypothetical protein
MNWEALAAVSQLAEAIAVVVALLYAWQQVRAMRREQLLGAIWEIYRELHSSETRHARRYVYRNRALYETLTSIDDSDLSHLPEEARGNAERVGNTFDRVGYVVYQGLIPARFVLDGYYHVIARCWIVLEPFVQAVRAYTGENSYQQYFEYLALQVFTRYISRGEVNVQVY